jgi:hypothetical protein
VAFNADVMHELAAQFLTLAQAQGKGIFPLLSGHRLMATSLMFTGELAATGPMKRVSFSPDTPSLRRSSTGSWTA